MSTILLVDDEKDCRNLVRLTLELEKYTVVTACDGVEALSKIESENPDLILLDLNMPKMDGYETCRRIRQNPKFKKIAIIIVTVRRKEKEQVKGLNLGADDYITKPFHAQELLARVGAVLRRTEGEKGRGTKE